MTSIMRVKNPGSNTCMDWIGNGMAIKWLPFVLLLHIGADQIKTIFIL